LKPRAIRAVMTRSPEALEQPFTDLLSVPRLGALQQEGKLLTAQATRQIGAESD
jgi:hypothetical protein